MKAMDDKDDSQHVFIWGKHLGAWFQETIYCVLGFIPRGLEGIYERWIIKVPLLGKLLGLRLFSFPINIFFGLFKEVASDGSRLIGWPLGFVGGALLGSTLFRKLSPPSAPGGRLWNEIHPYAGALVLGVLLTTLGLYWGSLNIAAINFSMDTLVQAIGAGLLLGFVIKSVSEQQGPGTGASMALIQANAKKAKTLANGIKGVAKEKAKGKIFLHAQDILQQLNGGLQESLEEFFKENYALLSEEIHYRIDRHLDYLADRACHGDTNALNKLEVWYKDMRIKENTLDNFLDRLFHGRNLLKLKDTLDNAYDSWCYRGLKTAI